jgi:hypothetical protein
MDYDLFKDSFLIFIKYINRQFKQNKDYSPHPLIRAFICAMQNIDSIKTGECTAGVSQDENANRVTNPYMVVLEKKENGIEVKEIHNFQVGKAVPIDIPNFFATVSVKST